uniref:AlNc14C130G6940 protein n=1 Tax=Albugo laibachii Nc14 TaxID=890382 RepID=F0WK88_9STRA|nr:AlNc14C130G6940 [Albugo laibachii Nc14]|eukprot:CCA21691.1 AlNc14C130G6940 [Albugo laibachii Nc14]
MVKIPAMLLQYIGMFVVPTAIAVCFWKPKSDEEIRERIERQIPLDSAQRKKRNAKFAELLLQSSTMSSESREKLQAITSFKRK